MRSKDKIIFLFLILKKTQFSQFCNDFVKNIRDPVEPFNKQINKSVYHDCKKIYGCFEGSISKSDHGSYIVHIRFFLNVN